MDNEGVGLYKTQSMINHSCRPNAKIHFLSDSNELTGYYGVLILRVSLFFIDLQNYRPSQMPLRNALFSNVIRIQNELYISKRQHYSHFPLIPVFRANVIKIEILYSINVGSKNRHL